MGRSASGSGAVEVMMILSTEEMVTLRTPWLPKAASRAPGLATRPFERSVAVAFVASSETVINAVMNLELAAMRM